MSSFLSLLIYGFNNFELQFQKTGKPGLIIASINSGL